MLFDYYVSVMNIKSIYIDGIYMEMILVYFKRYWGFEKLKLV